jgi:acyl-CoA thioester hydrolase
MTRRSAFGTSDDYRTAYSIPTRWMDNDIYNHVNNVVYYSWFDTAVNAHLLEAGLLDPEYGAIIGLVVESQCRYDRAISFPEVVTARLRVGHLGTSSVRYEIGLFTDACPEAAAEGHFIHVYVDRTSRRPVALPEDWRRTLARIAVASPAT